MKKKFNSMKRMNLLICVMVLSLSAYAQDTRTEVNEFNATSNIADIMVYGHKYERLKITMAEGSVAYFPSSMTDIRKKDESGNWQAYYSTILRELTKLQLNYVLMAKTALFTNLEKVSNLKLTALNGL